MQTHDARHHLWTLGDLLAALPALLRAEGVPGADAARLALEAAELRAAILLARTEAAARQALCASC